MIDVGSEQPGGDATTQPRPTADDALQELSSFRVDVVRGTDTGLSVILEAPGVVEALVGTSELCELRLTDPLVSRRHLCLSLVPSRVHLVDVGSTNGTQVGGLTVRDALLRGGESVTLGDTVLAVRALGAVGRTPLPPGERFGRVLGKSARMRRIYAVAERLARSDVPVILEGETGTGKEALAEAIHEASRRRDHPFAVFDCTLGPATLVEDALFGHERGAFTGAGASRAGIFELAHGGTLLLDEIGDLDLALQAKLLRAVQERRVQRIGSAKWTEVDVRVLAATRRDLDRAIQAGRFRDDLYYRLAVARVRLPPLRERQGDVRLLAESFWKALSGDAFPPELAADLERYDWPGNVRELRNAVAHRLALGDLAEPESLYLSRGAHDAGLADGLLARVIGQRLTFSEARRRVLEAFETAYLEDVLDRHQGNISKAAGAAGIARRYFYQLRARAVHQAPTSRFAKRQAPDVEGKRS